MTLTGTVAKGILDEVVNVRFLLTYNIYVFNYLLFPLYTTNKHPFLFYALPQKFSGCEFFFTTEREKKKNGGKRDTHTHTHTHYICF